MPLQIRCALLNNRCVLLALVHSRHAPSRKRLDETRLLDTKCHWEKHDAQPYEAGAISALR